MARWAFVQNAFDEHFGIMYISAFLKRNGHKTELFLGNANRKLIEEILNFKPDIVAFSCTTGIHQWCLQVAQMLKAKRDVLTIFGGAHPTFSPEIINEKEVDIICIGEGEYASIELSQAFDSGRDISHIANLWVKRDRQITKNEMRPLIDDLDILPFPDRELYYKKYSYISRSEKAFLAGRGCPYRCSFCFQHVFRQMCAGKGRFVRRRTLDNLINEIAYTKNKYRFKTVFMLDDTFILNEKWTCEFLEKYKQKIGLPLICQVRADQINEDIVSSLKEADCLNVFFGIESGSEKLRNCLLRKVEKDEDIIETANLFRKYAIRFRTFNILGFPGESLDEAFKTVEINIRIGTDFPWCSLFQPYPRTELGEYARNHGYLEGNIENIDPSFFYRSIISSDYKDEFFNLQKLFFYAVKFPKLFPLIKKLIKLPPNIFFNLAFLISFAFTYLKSHNISFKEMVPVGLKALGFFFGKNK